MNKTHVDTILLLTLDAVATKQPTGYITPIAYTPHYQTVPSHGQI